MSITSVHPEYADKVIDWRLVEDTKDERKVKSKGETYLPPTSGMISDGFPKQATLGTRRYEAYKTRSVFPELVVTTVNNLIGMMHRKPADIQLPEKMEPLRINATDEGESLQTLLRKINEAQLYKGRLGLLVDVPEGDINVLPYITFFKAENLINWDVSQRETGRERLDFVVIDESEPIRRGFDWRQEDKYRLLDRDPVTGNYRVRIIHTTTQQGASVTAATASGPNEEVPEDSESVVIPRIGGTTLEEIPFVFVGSIDMTSEPDQIPILPLSRLALVIYRGEADYRQSLFAQGQDTLVIIGTRVIKEDEDGETQVGVGALIELNEGSDAKYIGVSSQGLSEQKDALQNDYNRSRELGSSIVSSGEGGGKEAEGTIRVRVSARTASLMSIAKAGAEGLQETLRNMAFWMGLDPEEVVVTPNLDFVQDQVSPKDLLDLMGAKEKGFPLADETLHRFAKNHDMTVLEFDEEMKLLEKEMEDEEENKPLQIPIFMNPNPNAPGEPNEPDPNNPEGNPEEN